MIDEGEVDLGNGKGYPPLWSSDAQTIYCPTGGTVYAVSHATGEIQNLTEGGLDRYVFGIVHPLGSGIASHFDRPGSLVVMTRDLDTKREGLFRVGQGESVALVPEENRSLVRLVLYGDTRHHWIVGQVEDAANPPDLFAIHVPHGEERRLTMLNPEIDAVPRGPRRLI